MNRLVIKRKLHKEIKEMLLRDLGFEEEDYDEEFEEYGRVSTSTPYGCDYHETLDDLTNWIINYARKQ